MKKTFREVIATIKEGEVWVNEVSPISFIRLREDGVLDFNENEGVNLYNTYTLKRKEYTFEEAFKAYEEGKEIESLYSNKKYYQDISNEGLIEYLSIEEIRGKWHIIY